MNPRTAGEESEEQKNDAQMLMMASLIAKLAQKEQQGHTNGNGKGLPWQQWFVGLLSIFFGVLSFLFWDIRREVSDLRRMVDRTAHLTEEVDNMKKDYHALQRRLTTFFMRQDKYIPPKGGYEEDGP